MSVEPNKIDDEKRYVRSLAARSNDRWLHFGALAASLLFNLGVLLLLAQSSRLRVPLVSPVEEIPVEIVTAQPDAPPPELPPEPLLPEPPPPEPSKRPEPEKFKTLDEKPASDAPREESQAKQERETADPKQSAPKQAPPEKQAAASQEKPQEQTKQEQQAALPTPQDVQNELRLDNPDAEIIERAEKQNSPSSPPSSPAEKKDKAQQGDNVMENLAAAFANAPTYAIDSQSKKSIVSGGKAKATYLSTLYGLIMQNLHMPPGAKNRSTDLLVVSFYLSPNGVVLAADIRKTSGVPEIDRAVLMALRRASPFPPTPTGQPLALTFSSKK